MMGFYVFRDDHRRVSWQTDEELLKLLHAGADRYASYPADHRLNVIFEMCRGEENATGLDFLVRGLGIHFFANRCIAMSGPVIVTSPECIPPLTEEMLSCLENIHANLSDERTLLPIRTALHSYTAAIPIPSVRYVPGSKPHAYEPPPSKKKKS